MTVAVGPVAVPPPGSDHVTWLAADAGDVVTATVKSQEVPTLAAVAPPLNDGQVEVPQSTVTSTASTCSHPPWPRTVSVTVRVPLVPDAYRWLTGGGAVEVVPSPKSHS